MLVGGRDYQAVWCVDFEFNGGPGNRPAPVCLVAKDLVSGRRLSIWQDELVRMPAPPYSIGPDSLFVAFYASAEIGCHLALGWDVPMNVLDLYTEYCVLTNVPRDKLGPRPARSLLDALKMFDIRSIGDLEKEEMRQLVLRGGPWNREAQQAILAYCGTDVTALEQLLPAMLPRISSLPQALHRGRYMTAVARMEDCGIPIDTDLLGRLRDNWTRVEEGLIKQGEAVYGNVFKGTTLDRDLWERWLIEREIPWPRLPSGTLALDRDTFKEMAQVQPEIEYMHQLLASVGKMRLHGLQVGDDGRNRCLLSPFASSSGRNQPSTAKFIFGAASWMRRLIRPAEGMGLVYCDWSQQEFGIAAVFSGDAAMLEAYNSGDPYLAFAKQARACPPDATKKTHGKIRDQYKSCVLGVQYGMGPEKLAERIGQRASVASRLLSDHRRTYEKFWRWNQDAINMASLTGVMLTDFGWPVWVTSRSTTRSLGNFPMQAGGAEMMRLAVIFLTERGYRVCAPVHDALLVEATADRLGEVGAQVQAVMAEASAAVLYGFQLRSEIKLIVSPDRFIDSRGDDMWGRVSGILQSIEGGINV
jgi:DNA polymerase family A